MLKTLNLPRPGLWTTLQKRSASWWLDHSLTHMNLLPCRSGAAWATHSSSRWSRHSRKVSPPSSSRMTEWRASSGSSPRYPRCPVYPSCWSSGITRIKTPQKVRRVGKWYVQERLGLGVSTALSWIGFWMAKLFVSLGLNELSCFVNNNAISEAAWPQFSQSSHSCSGVAHLTPSPWHAL